MDQNQTWSKKLENSIIDKVFLLNFENTKKYLDSDGAWQCIATSYASEQEERWTGWSDKIDGDIIYCWWWLRGATSINGDGDIYFRPYINNTETAGVRPALWINLTS